MKDLEEALGQFVLYERLLTRYEPERKLYLAVPEDVRHTTWKVNHEESSRYGL